MRCSNLFLADGFLTPLFRLPALWQSHVQSCRDVLVFPQPRLPLKYFSLFDP